MFRLGLQASQIGCSLSR